MIYENRKTAFVYKWVHTHSLKWCIGSRTAKGCHPGDGYICSSKVVKPLIKANPQEWVRAIIEVGNPKEMLELESDLLTMFDAKNDPRSFNLHNNDGKFSRLGKDAPNRGTPHSPRQRAKMSAVRKGVIKSPEHRVKLSIAHKGKTKSSEHRAKLSAAQRGKVASDETKAKISAALQGRVVSDEVRAKISVAHKGRKQKPENVLKRIKTVIATNLTTGETFEINGPHEMSAFGFSKQGVSACARCVRLKHKGHSFRFKGTTQEV